MDFSPKAIRARFHALTVKHDAIQGKLQPLRDELDALGDTDMTVREARAREEAIRPQIKALQAELYPIEMERALCARALGGKVSA